MMSASMRDRLRLMWVSRSSIIGGVRPSISMSKRIGTTSLASNR